MRSGVPRYIRLIVSRIMRGMWIVASMRQNVNARKFLVTKKSNIKNRLEDLGTDTRIILNVSLLSDTGRCELDSFAENMDQWRAVWNAVMSLHLIKRHLLCGVSFFYESPSTLFVACYILKYFVGVFRHTNTLPKQKTSP